MTSAGGGRRYGSDLVVDLLREAGVEYVAFNPGSTIRGLHDSLVHAESGPHPVLCLHEGIAVGVAQGYAKACGRPMAVLLHDVVGLQNASMYIYNAWCDRVPMLLIGGTGPMSKSRRRPWIDWIHTATAQAEAVRHYVKWDDQPHDLDSVVESFARALTTAVACPPGPVYWCLDVDLQEQPLPDTLSPQPLGAYAVPAAPAPRAEDLDEVADLLRGAELPLIVTGLAGDTDEGFRALVELAELLHAPVLDVGPRLAFPTSHELWADGVQELLPQADLVLLLDVDDALGVLRRIGSDTSRPVVAITTGHLRMRSWAHDYQSLVPVLRHLTADSVPALQGLLTRLRADPGPAAQRERRQRLTAGRVSDSREQWRRTAEKSTENATVPLDRLIHEVGRALAGRRYVVAAGTNERLEHRLWDLAEPRQWCGHTGGGGLGYGVAAAVGVAIATGPGTVVVDVQADGDLLYAPQALWTAARLRLPLLVVVHNNRCYGNTAGHAREVAAARGRPPGGEYAGSGLTDPEVDIAGLARSMGVAAWGPVRDPQQLGPVLETAVTSVLSGAPALVEVITPGGPGTTTKERR